MPGTEGAQGAGLEPALLVVDPTAADLAALLAAVLDQAHPPLEGSGHHRLKIRHRAGDQIEAAGEQLLAPLLRRAPGAQQIHLEVVDGIAHRRGLLGQLGSLDPAEFLQHPQGLLHPARISRQHRRRLLPLLLGGMAQPSPRIRGRVAGQLEAVLMDPAQPLAQILAAGHQVRAIQGEASPVLEHPQPLTGPVEVGVEQAQGGGGIERHRERRSERETVVVKGLGEGAW